MTRLRAAMMLALALAAPGVFAGPVISVDNPFYSVSIPAAGTAVRHDFLVTNKGDRLLRITGVETSCTCTTASPTSAELAPGKSTAFSVAVDTTGFTGLVVRTVTLLSNDPANPRLMLALSITNTDQEQGTLPAISVQDFQKRFYVLLDVRTPEEFASGHLLGAVNVPLSELQNNLAAWTPRLPRDVPVILQCRSGVRSAQAQQILARAGFTNVCNLDGGITDWTDRFGSRYLFGF